ncbi:MAG: tetratricopeptide repeat protein [Alphaproteobacteria bacterium]|nr:tetratricopeptide repeat protein [Alphaproteobacteria bacterium]
MLLIQSGCAPDDGLTKVCEGGAGIAVNDAILACTKLVQSTDQTSVALSAAFNNRGRAYAQKRQFDQARADFDEAIRLRPENADAIHNRGVAYAAMSQYPLAMADFDRAIQLAPNFALAFFNRGRTNQTQDKFAEAVADYDQVIRLKPDFAEAFGQRGLAYKDLGKHDNALADYDRALRLKSDDAIILSNRGNLLNERGEYDKAIADLDRAIALKPRYALALNNRCWVRAVTGKALESGLADCTEALKYRSEHPGILDSRSVVYFRLSRFAEAIADADLILKAHPENASALYVRGAARSRSGEGVSGQADIAAAKAIDAKAVEEYAGYGVTP